MPEEQVKEEMQTHMLIVHVDAKDMETAIKAVKDRLKLAPLESLGYKTGEDLIAETSFSRIYDFVDIEDLEDYCDTCEYRCIAASGCPRKE